MGRAHRQDQPAGRGHARHPVAFKLHPHPSYTTQYWAGVNCSWPLLFVHASPTADSRHYDNNSHKPDKGGRGVPHVGHTQLVALHHCQSAGGATLQQPVTALWAETGAHTASSRPLLPGALCVQGYLLSGLGRMLRITALHHAVSTGRAEVFSDAAHTTSSQVCPALLGQNQRGTDANACQTLRVCTNTNTARLMLPWWSVWSSHQCAWLRGPVAGQAVGAVQGVGHLGPVHQAHRRAHTHRVWQWCMWVSEAAARMQLGLS